MTRESTQTCRPYVPLLPLYYCDVTQATDTALQTVSPSSYTRESVGATWAVERIRRTTSPQTPRIWADRHGVFHSAALPGVLRFCVNRESVFNCNTHSYLSSDAKASTVHG